MDWLDQSFCIPFLIWKQSVCCSISGSNCCFLFCIQISQEAGKVFWYSHLFKNIPQFVAIHTFKGFSVVSEAEVDVFSGILLLYLWCSGCWQLDPGSSAFSKSSLNIWKFSVHICWSLAWRILSIVLLTCEISAIAILIDLGFSSALSSILHAQNIKVKPMVVL